MAACTKCGSVEQIEGVEIVEHSQGGYRPLTARVFRKPQALVFKDEVMRPLRASACGSCGYVELYVPNPAEFVAEIRRR